MTVETRRWAVLALFLLLTGLAVWFVAQPREASPADCAVARINSPAPGSLPAECYRDR